MGFEFDIECNDYADFYDYYDEDEYWPSQGQIKVDVIQPKIKSMKNNQYEENNGTKLQTNSN